MSYLRCVSDAYPSPAPYPAVLPNKSPVPPPMAAPAPAFPETAPSAAPAPAPMAVPTAAPDAVLRFAASLGFTPTMRPAHCLQSPSSFTNCSKDLPGVGRTMTLGPLGTVAHPHNAKKEMRQIFL